MGNGRLTTEAAEIVVEMLQGGVVQGDLKWLSGKQTPPTFKSNVDMDTDMPYFIGCYWVHRDLSWSRDALVGFSCEADRKEFKRRWRERYPNETKPETQVETKSKSETKLTYPLFAKSRTNGTIILFTSRNTGVCLFDGTSNNRYAEWDDAWWDATDTDHWRHLTFAEAEAEIFGEKK